MTGLVCPLPWFSIVGSDTVSKFHRSVMPGDPEADQQFTLVISMLLNTLRTQLAMEASKHRILSARPCDLGTWTFHTLTTLPSPSPCMPTRSSKLSEALFSCSVVCFGNFDYSSTSLLEEPRLWWMPSVLVRVCNTHACSVIYADEHGSTTIRICRAHKHFG